MAVEGSGQSGLSGEDSSSDVEPILDLLDGFRRSKTLFTAVRLGIFDGVRPNARALGSLLEACVALGLLARQGEVYVNTPVAERYLRSVSPRSLTGYIRYADDVLYRLWAHLDAAVVEGADQWARVHGDAAQALRGAAYTSSDFVHGMHGLGLLSSTVVVARCDLSRFGYLVDLGGGTGQLAAAAKRRFPALRVAVFDYPQVLARARPYLDPAVECLPGDFLTDPLPAADVFVLGRILHHRDDARCQVLLGRLHHHLRVGGGVLVVERFLDRDAPTAAHMSALNMLVCTNGGRERSMSEYERLLRASGFSDVHGETSGAPLDWMLAIK